MERHSAGTTAVGVDRAMERREKKGIEMKEKIKWRFRRDRDEDQSARGAEAVS